MKKNFFLAANMLLLFAWSSHAQWIQQASGQFNTFDWVNMIRISDADHVWAGVSSLNTFGGVPGVAPRIARTVNGGQKWDILSIDNTDGYDVWGMSVLGPDTAYVSLNLRQSPNDRLYRTTDGGQTWDLVVEAIYAGYQVYFQDALHGLLSRGPYNTRYTIDGGQTWLTPQSMPTGLINQSIFNYPGSETEIVDNRFFAGLEDGHLLRTDDVGQTWEAFATPVNTPISDLAFENKQTGLALAAFFNKNGSTWTTGSPSRLFHTNDGGQSWTEIPPAQLPFDSSGINVIEATGTPGEYVMNAKAYGVSGIGYQTFKSTDGGQSWQLVATCPTEPLGVIEFAGPNIGFGGTSILMDSNNGSLFFKWGQPGPPKILLTVDMGDIPVSPQGLHVSCNYNQWNPAATPMTNTSGSKWSVSIETPADSTLYYRFVNGINDTDSEDVPVGCSTPLGATFVRTAKQQACGDLRAPEVLFGHCLPNGELEPQASTTCDTSGAYLICETFDQYSAGKIGPQSDIWNSSGCNYDGTEGDDCDVDLHGYSDGFTSYSGKYALHPNGIKSPLGQYIDLNLGNLNSGKYALNFRLYVPENNGGSIVIFFDYENTFSSIDLYVPPKGLLTYNKYDGETYEYGADTSFFIGYNTWHTVGFEFDLNAGSRSLWWDGNLVHTIADPQVNRLVSMNFGGGGNGYFIDDITLKDLLFVQTSGPNDPKPIFLVTPNPAKGSAIVQYAATESADLYLVDPMGRLVFQTTLAPALAGRQQLVLDELPEGIYWLFLRKRNEVLCQKLSVSK